MQSMSVMELLQCQGAAIDRLMDLGIIRTRNNPLGEYTEWLVCSGLGLQLVEKNSHPNFDAVDPRNNDQKYQIKGRRPDPDKEDPSRPQLSPAKGLGKNGFDFLVAVIYEDDFSIQHAIKIPYDVALGSSTGAKRQLRVTQTLREHGDVVCIKQQLLPYERLARARPTTYPIEYHFEPPARMKPGAQL